MGSLNKMASRKPIRKNQLVLILEKVWKLQHPADYYKVDKNVMLVKLGNKLDQDKVLEKGPWSMEEDVFLVQRWKPGITGDDFVNSKINIWVHVHGLPY